MTGFSGADLRTIAARSLGRCEICGSGNPVQTHHRKPRRAGGTTGARARQVNAVPNGLRVCQPCHDIAEKDRTAALHLGHLVPEAEDPRYWQAWLTTPYGPGWFRLDPEGGYEFAPARGADDEET